MAHRRRHGRLPPGGWGTIPALCAAPRRTAWSPRTRLATSYSASQEPVVDTSSSDSRGPDSTAFLLVKAGADQGTLSRRPQDHYGFGGNSESLPRANPDATPVPRGRTAGAVSGGSRSDDAGLRIVRTGRPSGLLIAGDIDEFTYPQLTAALTRVANGDGDIHLDLARVRYCDLAGLRALARLSGGSGEQADHGSRRVVLHGLPRTSRPCSRSSAGTPRPAWP